MKWVIAAVGGLLTVIVSGIGFLLWWSIPPDPAAMDEQVAASVTLHYDPWRRPFVRAATLDDALFAQGWLHARERLWQMELMRRAGKARLAEALGRSVLDTDVELTRAGVPALAEQLERNSTAEVSGLITRYVEGINAGVQTLRVRPPEFLLTQIDPMPWTASDVYAVAALTAFESGRNHREELLRLALQGAVDAERFDIFLPDESKQPGYPWAVAAEDALAIYRRTGAAVAELESLLAGASLGSNGWAVSPERSATGHALFAFDSHDAFSAPSLLYENHLFFFDSSGVEQSIRGWSVPGLPFVINGFNQHLAWGFTNTGDSQDLFIERRDASGRFLGTNGAYEPRTERIEIPVRDNPAHVLEVKVTENGRLLSDEPPIALRWIGHDVHGFGLDALLRMNTATDWPSFEAAINQFAAPSANATYADVHGTIALRTVGLLPVRGEGEGLLPTATGSPWQGTIEMTELPRRVNPVRGFVAAANAAVNAGAPLISADNAPAWRMQRLVDVLSRERTFNVDDMSALQVDRWNLQAQALLPVLLETIPALLADETFASALTELQAFATTPDNQPSSPGAVIFEQWYVELAKEVFGKALPEPLFTELLNNSYVLNHALDRLILREPESLWWRGEQAAIVGRALLAACDRLTSLYGSDPKAWTLARVQTVHFKHELSGAFPGASKLFDRQASGFGGGNSTLARARHRYSDPFKATGGATVRVVLEMSKPIRAFAVIPGGQSGHPLSPHYDDQLGAWMKGELLPLAARPEDAGPITTTLHPVTVTRR